MSGLPSGISSVPIHFSMKYTPGVATGKGFGPTSGVSLGRTSDSSDKESPYRLQFLRYESRKRSDSLKYYKEGLLRKEMSLTG